MKDSICELIKEVLPLYLENDVSEETKNIIDEHLKNCSKCGKLVSEYSKDKLHGLEEVDEMIEGADSFKRIAKRFKRFMLGILIVMFIVILSIGTTGYYVGRSSHMDVLNVKKEDDIINYYYERIPGLRRAQREGNLQNICRSAELPEGVGEIYYDKIWYTKETIYLFYHVDLFKPVEDMDMFFVNGFIHWNDGNITSDTAGSGGTAGLKWIKFDKKYYRVVSYPNHSKMIKTNSEEVKEKLKIKFEIDYSASINGGHNLKLPEVEFSVLYDPLKDKTYEIAVNKKVKIRKGSEILFENMVFEPQRSILKLKYFDDGGNNLYYLKGTLITDTGEKKSLDLSFSKSEKDSEEYTAEFYAMDSIPKSVEIKIDELQIVTTQNLKFEIDAKQFHGKLKGKGESKKINKKIGRIGESDIYLEKLFWDDRGVDFIIFIDKKGSDVNTCLNSWASEEEYKKRLLEDKDYARYQEVLNRRMPTLTKFTNEKGEIAQMNDYGQGGSGPGPQIERFIGKEFIEKSDIVYVEIFNLVETVYCK